ncbi:MAG: FHA domain-containing protein [Chloracidobacterium sp.]|nr:FHA domain-containing protein [Chloracidobacterium sp.]
MPTLTLRFTDTSGEKVTAEVERTPFLIGRHSSCDLTITDSRLSREHLVIDREGDEYFAVDRGSSNGTRLNGDEIFDQVKLSNGDELDLGGLEMQVEISTTQKDEASAAAASPESANLPPKAALAATPPAPAGISKTFFIIAPLMALAVLVLLGVMLLTSTGGRTSTNNDVAAGTEPFDTPTTRNTAVKNDAAPTPDIGQTPVNSGSDVNSGPTPKASDENSKIEQAASAFLRSAAANDPRAFITGAQAQILAPKVRSVASASATVDNIASAKKNAAALKALAQEKNLKPQFLAVAAIAKLGNDRGDVLATARAMAPALDQFSIQIGNERGDDCLLMIAALDQGDPVKMRNMLQDLATKSNESSRTIRTIWFLQKNGKITDAEYNTALNFLAVGTVVQDPRSFGLTAEPLAL